MATETPNHKLIKPEMTDPADISMINPNWDTLDTALKAVEDRVQSLDDSIASARSFAISSTNTAQTFTLRDGSMYVIRCIGVASSGPVYLGHVSTSGGNIYLNEIKASGISVSSSGLDLTVTTDFNYVRIHIERLKLT